MEAALIMFQHRIGSLPVVEDGKLIGPLTGRSVLAALGAKCPSQTGAGSPG